jgi:predicted ATPase
MSLMVSEVRAAGYRSLRAIQFPLARLSVFAGANGAGKTNLYRTLQLLQASAAGTLSYELAAEGGMESALWAGRRKKNEPARISLMAGFAPLAADGDASDGSFSYHVEIGLAPQHKAAFDLEPQVHAAAFKLEPQVKEETLTFHHCARPIKLLERRGPHVVVRDDKGLRVDVGVDLMASETALGSLAESARFPDLELIRRTMLDWRFYHVLRTDRDSPLRRPCLAVTSPTLSSDGSNLAAVFATLVHIRQDVESLRRMINDAFAGARLVVPPPERAASFGMIFPDYPQRVFDASELSDGTLRYLALAGTLMAYRLPAFIALNEPEASLHPDLLDPLARLIVQASSRTQIWLVTHSEHLAASLRRHGEVEPHTVVKRGGETWIQGLKRVGGFDEDEE